MSIASKPRSSAARPRKAVVAPDPYGQTMDHVDAIPMPPPGRYAIGQRIRCGSHDQAVIENMEHDGRVLCVCCSGVRSGTRDDGPYTDRRRIPWMEAGIITATPSAFTDERDADIVFQAQARCVSDIIGTKRYGWNLDAPYQRGLVWDDGDRAALLDTIFARGELGKIVMLQNNSTPYHTILDGKQRLTTLASFYEGAFAYRGRTYQELSDHDQNTFDMCPLPTVMVAQPMTMEQQIRYFLRVNRTGKAQDPAHLARVEQMLSHGP